MKLKRLEQWQPEIRRAICKRCSGLCCRLPELIVVLDREEADGRLRYFKHERRIVGFETRVPVVRKTKEGACVYFDNATKGCSIYDRRPGSCRAWFCGRGTKHDTTWKALRQIVEERERAAQTGG